MYLDCLICTWQVDSRQARGGETSGGARLSAEAFQTALGSVTEAVGVRANHNPYMGTSLIRNCFLLGPHIRTMPRALWWC